MKQAASVSTEVNRPFEAAIEGVNLAFQGFLRGALAGLSLRLQVYRLPDEWDSRAGFPGAPGGGVYAFFDENNGMVRVDSCRDDLGRHICARCCRGPQGEWYFSGPGLAEAFYLEGRLTLAVIPFPDKFISLAPVLASMMEERIPASAYSGGEK